MVSSPRSIATTLAWNAVGVHDSLRVTCMTGQTSRQNLWPEEKQLYDALRHCAVNSSVSVGSSGSSKSRAISSGMSASSSGLSRMPGREGHRERV